MNKRKKNERSDASVIIPSYNHLNHIGTLLTSLMAQNTQWKYEVIVVDSGQDSTAEFIEKNFPTVKLIKLKERAFPGQARNIGVEHARSDIYVFTDTDCHVSPDWIEVIVNEQKSGKMALVGPVKNGTPIQIFGILDYLLEFYDTLNVNKGVKIGPVGTVNVSYHKTIFQRFGPLDSFIKGSDSRFSRKILAAGIFIFHNKKMIVWHHNRTNIFKVYKNQYLLGLGAARTNSLFKTKGKILTDYPVLILFMPFVRTIKIGSILFTKSPVNFIFFILLYPLIFAGLAIHAFGFAKGSRQSGE
ncbi:glycosyltransferase [candidate division KSB1 bacterium]|nr:glycosyltransferase [candidate division KSB1 bacterium]